MYHVSVQGVDECMINVHFYCYYMGTYLCMDMHLCACFVHLCLGTYLCACFVPLYMKTYLSAWQRTSVHGYVPLCMAIPLYMFRTSVLGYIPLCMGTYMCTWVHASVHR